MSIYNKTFLLFFITISFGSWAQGFQVNLQGQKQQGMGGAGTALMQDGAALFYNPGGAAFVKGNEINLAMTPTFAHSIFLDANTNQTAITKSPVSTPFSNSSLIGISIY